MTFPHARMRPSRPLGAVATFVAVATLSMPTLAQAAYEQVPEHFGTEGEAAQVQLGSAIAVNQSGAGGVPPGSVYIVGENGRVVRFSPGKEGEEPKFTEAWGWSIAAHQGKEAYERCGPAYSGTANSSQNTYEECAVPPKVNQFPGEQTGNFGELSGVAIDQATGDVYVRTQTFANGSQPRQKHLIEVFSATGEPIGEGFGESADGAGQPPESIADSPQKLHRAPFGRIAVDASGRVYLTDNDYSGVEHPQSRVMSFEPCSAEDYETYCYAAGKDIPLQEQPEEMSLVGSNLLVGSEEVIREYSSSSGQQLCSVKTPGQLYAMTANELTGEVFDFTFHSETIKRFAACDEETGAFAELQTIVPSPATDEIRALGVDPTLSWGPTRPAGILYANDSKHAGTGDVFALAPAAVAPTVEGESTASSTATSTTLQAQVNPGGYPVTYYFEYLSGAGYLGDGESFEGSVAPTRAPIGAGQLASGAPATVAVPVTGLAPETEYRYRIVASSECNGAGKPPCVTTGAVAAFATYPTASRALPDGRGYELVSPIDKNGGEVFPIDPARGSCIVECKPPGVELTAVYPMQNATDGNAVTYEGYPFSPAEGSAVFNSYVSRRGETGWQTTVATPPLLATKGGTYLAYSADLTEAVISQGTPQLSSLAPAGFPNLYLQSVADPGSLTPLLTTAPPNRKSLLNLQYAGHSADFKAQYFSANDALTHATPYAPEPSDPGETSSDLYEWRKGSLALVNVLPGNAAVATGATFATSSPDANGIAAGGRRVFWVTGDDVYVREDAQITRELRHAGTFLAASENGEEVLFTDGCLYSLLTETCTDLTQGRGGFMGEAGHSDDLSRVYFVDSSELPAPSTGDLQGQAGQPNLYMYEAGVGSKLVATVNQGASEDWAAKPGARTAEASANGRYLAFLSTAELTHYDNVGPCEEITTNAVEGFKKEWVDVPCAEVFVYDATAGAVSCASCDPTGEHPLGDSYLPQIDGGGNLPQPRYVTDRGQVFFDSQDRLSPSDVNGRVEDVYEAEPSGVGSCTRGAGCVSLISGGTGADDSDFLAMGGEGEDEGADVFFTTRQQMLPADTDEQIDLYDARVGAGGAAEAEAQPGECTGEACQSAVGAVSGANAIFGPPASVTFLGAGNLAPLPTAKAAPLTRAQKLAKALKACRRKKTRAKRLSCEATARRSYGAKQKHARNAPAKAHRG